MFQDLNNLEFWIKLFFALICGGVIGLERQIKGKPIGIRTSILICLGTMLFIHLASMILGGRELARVLGQVVTGIGFLGAGVIMTKGGIVSGVTSAAEVWLMAGIGSAIGMGFYGIGIMVTLIALLALILVQKLEASIPFLRRGDHEEGQSGFSRGETVLKDRKV